MKIEPKLHAKLTTIHDMLYEVIGLFEDMKIDQRQLKLQWQIMNRLDTVNGMMEKLMESD